MIINELVEQALSKVEKRKIKDVRAGLGYTCVMLENGDCGLAYTFRNALGQCCDILNEAGSLIGKNASEMIPWLKDKNCLKATIGLATINAVLNNSCDKMNIGNLMDTINVSSSDSFGMVGEFKPILKRMNDITKNIFVFEKDTTKCGETYSENAISLRLPECNVVVITATCIINHTIDKVLLYCKNAREVCIVGPSTPLCYEVFKRYHVHLLAGSVVTHPDQILEIVSQGGGTMKMKPAIKQVLIRV